MLHCSACRRKLCPPLHGLSHAPRLPVNRFSRRHRPASPPASNPSSALSSLTTAFKQPSRPGSGPARPSPRLHCFPRNPLQETTKGKKPQFPEFKIRNHHPGTLLLPRLSIELSPGSALPVTDPFDLSPAPRIQSLQFIQEAKLSDGVGAGPAAGAGSGSRWAVAAAAASRSSRSSRSERRGVRGNEG